MVFWIIGASLIYVASLNFQTGKLDTLRLIGVTVTGILGISLIAFSTYAPIIKFVTELIIEEIKKENLKIE